MLRRLRAVFRLARGLTRLVGRRTETSGSAGVPLCKVGKCRVLLVWFWRLAKFS